VAHPLVGTQLIYHKQGGDNGVYFLVKVNLIGSPFDKLQGYIKVKYGHTSENGG
jgi:hypothetical protein